MGLCLVRNQLIDEKSKCCLYLSYKTGTNLELSADTGEAINLHYILQHLEPLLGSGRETFTLSGFSDGF